MEAPRVVVLFRPRQPGEAFEIWHVASRGNGDANVIVERESSGSGGTISIDRPFGAPISRLVRLVDAESDRILTGKQQTVERLRSLSSGLMA